MIEEWVNKVICGDALELIPRLPDGSIDAVVTDPPYGIEREVAVITRKGGKFGSAAPIHKGIAENPETVKGVRYDDWIPLVFPKLKKHGVLVTFCEKRKIGYVCDLVEELGMVVRNIVIWIVTNPPPQARKVKWMDAWQPIVIATKNRGAGHHYNWRMGQHPDYIITSPLCMGKERTPHPTQKPLDVVIPLVKWWTFEGDVVLDPFAGSGTTAVACKLLGRKWICFEINPRYVEIARRRLSQTPIGLASFTTSKA